MDRIKLIAYSLMASGEYDAIVKFINNETQIPNQITEKASRITNAITIYDKEYPKKLLALKYPPMVIFYKGNKELLTESAIAVIGSREHTEYAGKATETLCQKTDKVVISGLAKGIDAIAHANARKTIAVLGCGIDYIYPQCNSDLFKRIEKEGLIISEYPELTKPAGYHFPFRNRIVAALSEEVYVAETQHSSGTMITINEALELGINIRVLPFDIFTAMEKSIANNKLINEGAMCWDIGLEDKVNFGLEVVLKHGH